MKKYLTSKNRYLRLDTQVLIKAAMTVDILELGNDVEVHLGELPGRYQDLPEGGDGVLGDLRHLAGDDWVSIIYYIYI